jgi:hypothetical protein
MVSTFSSVGSNVVGTRHSSPKEEKPQPEQRVDSRQDRVEVASTRC